MRGLWIALLVTGCSGLSFEEYVDQVPDVYCGYLVRCDVASSVADCRSYNDRFGVNSPSLAAGVENGTVRYDEDAAQRCIDAYGALSCDTTKQPDDALDACNDVFQGTQPTGDACAFDLQCESNNCQTPTCSEACCPGTCQPTRALPRPDEPCTSICEEGSYCGADAICHTLLPAGAACDRIAICASDLYCAGISSGGSGVCKALPKLGEPCESKCAEVSSMCSLGVCIESGLAGDACEYDLDCSYVYGCTVDHTCGDYPTLGMPCETWCSGEAYCKDRICQALEPNGASCMFSLECATHFCGNDDLCGDPPLCI